MTLKTMIGKKKKLHGSDIIGKKLEDFNIEVLSSDAL